MYEYCYSLPADCNVSKLPHMQSCALTKLYRYRYSCDFFCHSDILTIGAIVSLGKTRLKRCDQIKSGTDRDQVRWAWMLISKNFLSLSKARGQLSNIFPQPRYSGPSP